MVSHNFVTCACLFALGWSVPSGNAIASPTESDCPTPITGPKRACAGDVSDTPPRRISPEEVEQAQRTMRQDQIEYEARPKPIPETGIIPVPGGIEERMGRGSYVENYWYEIVNGLDVIVYAGYMDFDPTDDSIKYDPMTAHGFVVIDKGQLGEPSFKRNRIYTPTAVGSLRIVAAKDNVLRLRSRQGVLFSLNVETEVLTPLPAK